MVLIKYMKSMEEIERLLPGLTYKSMMKKTYCFSKAFGLTDPFITIKAVLPCMIYGKIINVYVH